MELGNKIIMIIAIILLTYLIYYLINYDTIKNNEYCNNICVAKGYNKGEYQKDNTTNKCLCTRYVDKLL